MEITCTFSINDSDEIAKALYPKTYTFIIRGCSLLIIFYAIFNCFQNNLATSLIIIVIAIVGIILLQLFLSKQQDKFKEIIESRFKEANKINDEIIYHYQFNDDYILVTNKVNEGQVEIYYDDFNKYIETENYVLVMTKAKQYIIFNKDVAQKHDLKNYLKQKYRFIRG